MSETVTNEYSGIPLEAVSCDLCGTARDRTFLTLSDVLMVTSDQVYRIARCRKCDLLYLNPRPVPWVIPSLYPETYAPFKRSRLAAAARQWLHDRSVRDLKAHLGYPNRILDVGCATGELLHAIRSAGNPNVQGIEPSRQAASVARDQYALDVITGNLEQTDLPAESYDTVLLSHVLEHVPSPSATLAEIHRILKPGGVVIIWVPNANSWAARLLGQNWMGWDVPRHLYAFTPGSLYRFLTGADLQFDSVFHERHGMEWAWGVRLWVRQRFQRSDVDRAIGALHPALSALLTPLGALSATFGQSGRIRIIGRKPSD